MRTKERCCLSVFICAGYSYVSFAYQDRGEALLVKHSQTSLKLLYLTDLTVFLLMELIQPYFCFPQTPFATTATFNTPETAAAGGEARWHKGASANEAAALLHLITLAHPPLQSFRRYRYEHKLDGVAKKQTLQDCNVSSSRA